MAENTSQDKRLEHVKQRLHDEMVDEKGRPAEPDEVDSIVDAKAESLSDAPVQEFTPLLIEHAARDELRQQGLHRDLGDETADVSGNDGVEDQPAGRDARTDDSGHKRDA